MFTLICKQELNWWLEEGLSSLKPISNGNPQFVIQTDSSKLGWGALLLEHNLDTQGLWTTEEQDFHINYLELKAAHSGIKALCNDLHDCHLQVQLDNQTSVIPIFQIWVGLIPLHAIVLHGKLSFGAKTKTYGSPHATLQVYLIRQLTLLAEISMKTLSGCLTKSTSIKSVISLVNHILTPLPAVSTIN